MYFDSASISRPPQSKITLSKQHLADQTTSLVSSSTRSLARSHLSTSGMCCSALASKGLFRVLQTYAQGGSRGPSVQEQLKREYGEPLWNRMQPLVRRGPPFSVPEVSRKDIELRSYAISSGGTANPRLQVGPKKDVCIIVRFQEDARPPPTLSPTQHLKYSPRTPSESAKAFRRL